MSKLPILKAPFYWVPAKLNVDENGNETNVVPCPWYLELDEAGESYHSRRCDFYIPLGRSSLKQYQVTAEADEELIFEDFIAANEELKSALKETLEDKYGDAATTEKEIPPNVCLVRRRNRRIQGREERQIKGRGNSM